MKIISSYESLDGELYRSKGECLLADAKHTLPIAIAQCSNPTIGFNIDDFAALLEQENNLKEILAPLFVVKRKKADKKSEETQEDEPGFVPAGEPLADAISFEPPQ